MKADRKTTKPISRGKSKTQEAPPTHKAVTPKPHEKKTESKQAETALHSAEENYRSIFEQAPVGIFQSTPQGRFRNVNSAMAQIYGYDSPEQMITEITSIGDQVYVNSSTRQEFQRVLAERGEIHNSLDEHYRKDGSRIWTQTTARAIKDKDGKVLFYEGFIIDVTERLQEQQQLHESEERFRALIENASDMILTITADGNLNYVSPAALRITGYQADEVIGRNIVEFIHADDLPLALQALASRSKISGLAPDPIELRFHHKDGMWRIVEILGNNLLEYPAVNGIVLNVRDITERKQAEAAVRESEDRYRDLVENSQDLICTHDLDGQILSANPRAEKMLGYEHAALLQMNFRDILAPEALPGLTAYLRRITKRGADQGQMIVQTKTGERRIWEYNNTLRTEGVSTPIVRGMARDITERKQAEQEIDRLARFPSENPNPVLRLSRDGIVMYANAASGALLSMWGCAVGGSAPQFWRDLAAQLLVSRENKTVEVELDGKVYSMFVTPVAEPGYVNLYGRDITERRRAEETLRTSQQIIEGIINTIPVRVFWKDKNLVYLGCNAVFAHDKGFTDPKDVIGKDDYQMARLDQAELYRGDDRQVIESGSSKLFVEEPQTTPEGNIITLLTSKVPLRNSKGEVIGVLGTYMDITDRKRAEDELRAISTRQEAILAAVPDILMEVDKDKVYTWANPAGVEFFGEDVIGNKEAAFYFEGDQDTYGAVKPLFNGSKDVIYVESWQRRKDGEKRLLAWWCRVLKDTDGNVTGALSSAHDITERKHAEDALRAAEEKYRTIFEGAVEGIFQSTPEGRFLTVNPALVRMWGYASPEELISSIKDIGRQVYAQPQRREEFARLIQEHGEVRGFEYEVRCKEGELIWVSENARAVRDTSETLLYYEGNIEDITERKRAEKALRESEERFRALIQYSHDAITLLAADGTVLYDSPSISRVLGYDPSERLGRSVFEFVDPEERRNMAHGFARFAQQVGAVAPSEVRFLHKDGTLRQIDGVRTNLLHEPAVRAVVVNYRDITERKQAEDEIKSQLKELERWQDVMLGRGDREQRLKREVNELCRRAGESARYPSQEIGAADSETAPAKS